MDIIVTTPKSQSKIAALEAEQMKNFPDGIYFRALSTCPQKLCVGDRIFYVENGYVRGYANVLQGWDSKHTTPKVCSTTGRVWESGCLISMPVKTWTWIVPIPMKGFQGWRYSKLKEEDIVVVGGWLDPMPEVLDNGEN